METKMASLRKILDAYPNSHVGGSIGLFLHGITLNRNICKSDFDISIQTIPANDFAQLEMEERSDANDFDFAYKITHLSGEYTKVDLRISPDTSFDYITHEDGFQYRVTKKDTILMWKKLYADKGVQKHKDDLFFIEHGFIPEPQKPIESETFDDLPF